MKRVSLSGSEKTIQAVWDWYGCQAKLSLEKKSHVLHELRQNQPASDPLFLGMTVDEIDEFFKELDYLAMLDILAATEAAIRVDYLNRAYHGRGDSISKHFRQLYKQGGSKVSLEKDILAAWKELVPATKRAVGDFNGALTLRHWLAHGRYWNPKLGRQQYSPGDIFDISDNLLHAIGA